MGFAAAWDGSRDIEVAEAGIAEAVDAVEPGEHLLDEQLGFAVGVGRAEWRVLADGSGFRLAVNGRCRGENEAIDADREHGLKEAEGGCAVVAEIEFRLFHAFAGFNESGKVHDAVYSGMEKFFEGGAVSHLALNELSIRGKHGTAGVAKVVVNDDLVTFFKQELGDSSTDVASAASNEDAQRGSP